MGGSTTLPKARMSEASWLVGLPKPWGVGGVVIQLFWKVRVFEDGPGFQAWTFLSYVSQGQDRLRVWS